MEHCIMCGAAIPEGRQICWECEHRKIKRAKKLHGIITARRVITYIIGLALIILAVTAGGNRYCDVAIALIGTIIVISTAEEQGSAR